MINQSRLTVVFNDFLASHTDFVLLLKGKWGAGKTYFWQHYLRKQQIFSTRKYKYVSLFGASTISSIKAQLAFNKTIGDLLNSDIFEYGQSLSIPMTGINTSIPFIKRTLIFLRSKFIKKCVICFDDIERKSDKLGIEEFIGLVNDLKNKGCKIILISNESKLNISENKIFSLMKERILDCQLELQTTAEEVVEAMLNADKFQKAARLCCSLKINNFRIVERIRSTLDVISIKITDCRDELWDYIQIQTTFLVWSYLQGEDSISIEFLKNYTTNNAAHFFRKEFSWYEKLEDKKQNVSDVEIENGRVLWEHDFFYEDLSQCILDYLVTGILDEVYLTKCVEAIGVTLRFERVEKLLQEVWELYNNDYTVSQKQFCASMVEFVSRQYKDLSINSFMQVKDFLSKLGCPLEQELIKDKYSHIISTIDRSILNTNFQFVGFGFPNDPIFSKMVKEELKKEVAKLDIIDAMKMLIKNRSDKAAIEYFDSVTDEGIYSWLISPKFQGSANLLRTFIKDMKSTEHTQQYAKKFEHALVRMSNREQIDRFRVELIYGIPLESADN